MATNMDDVTAKVRPDQPTQPQVYKMFLQIEPEARGLLTRIDHPVDKDTELHPLVRAVTGRWEETGRETLARQRSGLKPETPARKVAD
jgi:hypothetical protein